MEKALFTECKFEVHHILRAQIVRRLPFRLTTLLLLLYSQVTLACTETATSQEKQLSPAQEHQSINPQDDWVNEIHQSISDSVYQSALWFDSFFAEQGCEQQQPRTSARIRLTWRPQSEDLAEFDSRFRIKVKLPHLQDRVDLIFSDDSDDDLSQLPLQDFNQQATAQNESFSAAIRFIHKNETDRFTDSRLGISGGDIFIRARHQRRYSWQGVHGVKIEPALYYFLKDGLGAKLLLEYNYQLSHDKQLRFDYSIRASESFNGLRWRHGFYHLSQFGDDSAGALGLTVGGERYSNNDYFVSKYNLSYRYRFNALRKWLYFEVEPFVEWQKQDNFSATHGIALRIEGYFTKG